MRMRVWPILEQIEYIMLLKTELNDQIWRMILQTLSQHNVSVHLNKAKVTTSRTVRESYIKHFNECYCNRLPESRPLRRWIWIDIGHCELFTCYAQDCATRNDSGNAAAGNLFNDFTLRFGIPAIMLHCRGERFENDLFKDTLKTTLWVGYLICIKFSPVFFYWMLLMDAF